MVSSSRLITLTSLTLILGGTLALLQPVLTTKHTQHLGQLHNGHILASKLAATEHDQQPSSDNSSRQLDFAPHALQDNLLTKLRIERLGIELAIKAGNYDKNRSTWQLDRQHAFIAKGAATPTIYGHNIPTVFGKLNGIAPNEALELFDTQGNIYLFAYKNEIKVLPQAVEILKTVQPNTVQLITCDKAPFTYRRVLTFAYQGQIKLEAGTLAQTSMRKSGD